MMVTTTVNSKRKALSPNLRFKGFNQGWESKSMGDIGSFLGGGTPNTNIEKYWIGDIPWISSSDLFENDLHSINIHRYLNKDAVSKSATKVIPKNSVLLISRVGVGKLAVNKTELCTSQDFSNFIPTKCNSYFIGYFLLARKNLLINFAQGTSIKGFTTSDIKSLKISIPILPEQQKIASFLSAVDGKIQQLNRKKELLEQYKKGVMQQLFSGELRFKEKNGKAFPKWENRKLADVLHEHKLNSTGKEEVFSVSVHKGLINQVEHLGRVFAAKNTDNYNLVKPNDIIYTKSPTGSFPLGIIKQSKINKNVIVSPLYGVFTPETPGLGYILNVYFESPLNVKNYLSSIIQKGAKNTINITNTTFLSKKIKLPISKEEQQKIGDFLLNIDLKIENVSSLITQTQTFKKGLLQQMFV